MNVNEYIKKNVSFIGSSVYVSPEIPEKKLNNAIKAFKCHDYYQSIIAIQDATIFGGADEGFVFTGEKFIHHKHGVFNYRDIELVEYKRNVTIKDNGKEDIDEYVLIKKNGKEYIFKNHIGVEEKKFAIFLNHIIEAFDDYKEEVPLSSLSSMSNEIKIAYLKIIINMTFIDDNKIDERELAEIFSLMTRLELEDEDRFSVRSYITDISMDNLEATEILFETIKQNSEANHIHFMMISLAKDLINTHFSTKNTKDRDFKFLDQNKQLFGLSNADIDLAYSTVEKDYELLNGDLDDNTIEKHAKELAAKAAAAGAPLAAVYISGSVIGMSAAGITSGLATLGMGMGMTGGLAVIGLIGVLSYKGVKHLTGANELDKFKTRRKMLHDVIKLTHKTISLIINDINYLVKKINDLQLSQQELEADNENIKVLLINKNAETKKLMKMLSLFQDTLNIVDDKAEIYQNSENRIKNPKELDVERLKSLTSEPTKQPLYNFIINNYELKISNVKNNKNVYMLKHDVETETLDRMADAFQALEYFEIEKIIAGKASGFLKGILG